MDSPPAYTEPEWHQRDTYETKKFVEDVKDANFSGLFESPAYELWARDLTFIDGYAYYVLYNCSLFPPFGLHYISNGEDHYFLDGSEHSLELLVGKDAFRLTEANVLEYLDFHSDVAFYPYRKVKFIIDPTKTAYHGASAMGHHFKTLKYSEQIDIQNSEEDVCFYITLPVLYNGETVKGHVQVKKTGEITVLEPIRVPLMDKSRDHVPLDYDHPHEKELLVQISEVLCQSEEGKRLWDTNETYKGVIRVVSGVGNAGFAASSQLGYIVAPENVDTYSPYQAIALAGILREMELMAMDDNRPDPFDDAQEVLEQNIALNLDILRKICIIGDELYAAGHEEFLEKFKKSGFEAFYGGHKNKASEEELVRILAEYFGFEAKEE